MQKYLIRFSYIGTNFRGLQVQSRTKNDYQTIQGVLEAGLRYLQPANEPVTHTSSRTDAVLKVSHEKHLLHLEPSSPIFLNWPAQTSRRIQDKTSQHLVLFSMKGVHAFDNCLHVELLPRYGKSPYASSYITHHLNTFLRLAGVDIRVHNTQTVSPAFDARRSACKRHYLYRIAFFKEPLASDDQHYIGENYWPLPEMNRVFIVRKAVDMSKLIEGCALLQRNADFASFMAAPAKNIPPKKTTIRNLEKVTLSPGQPLMDASLDPAYSNLDFYNITFTSRSFLQNQIRRCVGVLLALAQGVITKDQVEHMFENPQPASSPVGVDLSPAGGLYLLKVDYPDHVLQPDYCGEVEVPDSILRWVAVRTRVKTMVAHGHSNFQKENSVVDKFCNVMRRLDDLRDSILKESVQLESVKENSSSESKTKENLSEIDENYVDNFETPKDASLLPELKRPSIEFNANEGKEDATSITDKTVEGERSESDYFMRGSKKRRMLEELYKLLMTRDDIDEKMRVLMEPLIKANVMNRDSYDEEAMERTARKITEMRRFNCELNVRIAGMSKLYLPRINEPTQIKREEFESVPTEAKN